MKSIFLNTLIQALVFSGIYFVNTEAPEGVITYSESDWSITELSNKDKSEGITFYMDYETLKSGITINGDVMRVSEDDPSAKITRVTMYAENGEVYSFFGCNDSVCDYNISRVPLGCYDVIVESSTGGFMETVCIN